MEEDTMEEIDRLRDIVRRLRSENGCPWDRVQTHESLKSGCIEEAAEVIGGINILSETGDSENLREELGDLLLHIMFHCVIAEEEALFTFEDIVRTVSDKMVRRHPHVFGNTGEAFQENQMITWEAIKQQEKHGREWHDDYLSHAFDEAEALLQKARNRKGLADCGDQGSEQQAVPLR